MSRYRIIKVKFENGSDVYMIQKRTRIFWIGPYIWETWTDDKHGNWSWFKALGRTYGCYNNAHKDLEMMIYNDGYNIVETNTVYEV